MGPRWGFLCLSWLFATSKLGLATRIVPNAPVDDAIGNNKEQHDQQYHEVASKVLADIIAQRDRILSRWKGGSSQSIPDILQSHSYSRSRYVPKYGRRYSGSFWQSLDEITNTLDNNDDDDSYRDMDSNVPCINLANMKYTKHKKSKSEDRYQHDGNHKSGQGQENDISYKGAHDSKSKSRSKSKSQSPDDYFDYCDDETVQAIQCTANVVDFMSAVALVFEGNPQFLTGPEQLALEDSFRDTYNGNRLHIV